MHARPDHSAPGAEHGPRSHGLHEHGIQAMGYGRFLATVATSTVLMFVLMYLNTFPSTTCFSARRACGWRWSWAR